MRAFERLRTVLADEVGVGPDPETVALYEKVLAAEGPETPTPAERARALLAWGLVHWNRKDLEEAERTSEEARALAVDAGLGRELGEASALLGMIAHARGRWRDLFRREFVESVQRSPQLAPFVFDAHLCLAEFSLYGPEGHEAIRAYADELLEVAEEADSVQGMALATLMMGEADLLSGRLEQAQTELTSAVDLHEAAHATSGHALSLERLAEVSLSRGRRWQARRILPRSLRLAEASALSSHLVSRVFGTMVVAAADANGSMAAISEAETALAQMEPCEPCSMGFRVNAAVASARAGDLKRAAGHLAEAERIAGMWQGGAWLAGVWEARAALREAQGELEQAAALYREAADLFAQMSRPLDAERCRAAATAST
jgi:tetratricopeptide (TPR) repeat protein